MSEQFLLAHDDKHMKHFLSIGILFLFVACGTMPRQNANVPSSSWIANTQAITRFSSNNTGFFSEYNPFLKFDPYATYYAVLTLDLLREPIPHPDLTKKRALEVLDHTINNVQTIATVMGDMYYLVETLIALDQDIPNKAAIKQSVEKLSEKGHGSTIAAIVGAFRRVTPGSPDRPNHFWVGLLRYQRLFKQLLSHCIWMRDFSLDYGLNARLKPMIP